MRETQPSQLTVREFLAWESRQSTKFEFAGGRPIAMAGATTEHAQVVGNLFALLKPHVRRGCRLYTNDVKVVTPRLTSRYPDLLLTCDPRDRRSTTMQRHPSLLGEVLSDATAATDRLEKLAEFKRIPELVEYLIVDSRRPDITLFRRGPGKGWIVEEFGPGETLWLSSLDVNVAVDAVYDDVNFPTRRRRTRT